MKTKKYTDIDVLTAARDRVSKAFDSFERLYISFSGGKDSSVMTHLVMDEAIKRNRKIGLLLIDLEAQYKRTITHATDIINKYRDNLEVYWCCLPIKLRNGSSHFEPVWQCWNPEEKHLWVRTPPDLPDVITDTEYFDWFVPNMEFEEFIVLFADWYSQGKTTGAFIGIRADESLNRFRTIAVYDKEMLNNWRWTTKVTESAYNIYPIYDWKTRDIWIYHSKNPDKEHNTIYDLMNQAGVSIHQQRLCQPYGDDQKKGLWLYHILEPETWYKVVNRVAGANSCALYIQESGNINGYNKVTKPAGHTYKSFCNLLLSTLPKVSRDHYLDIFRRHIRGWLSRGYRTIPDEAPRELENKHWAPSWRRLCKVLLRNDWWGKGLGLTQPKSLAYEKYLQIKKAKKGKNP